MARLGCATEESANDAWGRRRFRVRDTRTVPPAPSCATRGRPLASRPDALPDPPPRRPRARPHPGAHGHGDRRARPAAPSDLVLVGIQRRGVELADRLKRLIDHAEGSNVACGKLDITLYRDDLQTVGPRPVVGETSLPNLDGRTVVIVDDVLYTGRTVRAALDECADFGRPRRDPALRADRPRRPRAARSRPTSSAPRVSTGARRPGGRARLRARRPRRGRAGAGPDDERARPGQGPGRPRAAERRPDPPHPRHRRAVQGSERAADQEGAGAPRQDHRQSVLRGLHPDPDLASSSPRSG